MDATKDNKEFGSLSADSPMKQLAPVRPVGLTNAEASRRLQICGPNRLRLAKSTDVARLLLAQFKSPLILILLGAVILSFFLHEPVEEEMEVEFAE